VPAVYTKDEDQAVVITGTVNNLHLSNAFTAAIALLQPVAVPASYCLCSAVKAPASVTVSAESSLIRTALVISAAATYCPYRSSSLLSLPLFNTISSPPSR